MDHWQFVVTPGVRQTVKHVYNKQSLSEYIRAAFMYSSLDQTSDGNGKQINFDQLHERATTLLCNSIMRYVLNQNVSWQIKRSARS